MNDEQLINLQIDCMLAECIKLDAEREELEKREEKGEVDLHVLKHKRAEIRRLTDAIGRKQELLLKVMGVKYA